MTAPTTPPQRRQKREGKMSRSRIKIIPSEEEFQVWLFYIPDTLEDFFDWLPPELTEKLDFSLESLIPFEVWILERYSSVAACLAFDQRTVLDACGLYVGEVLRQIIKRPWRIELKNKKSAAFGIPELDIPSTNTPITYVTACCDRRTGDFIYRGVKRCAENYVLQENL